MTFTQAVVDYINGTPGIPNVTLDLLPPEKADQSLAPAERDLLVKRYITGAEIRRFTASIFASQTSDRKLQAIDAINAIQAALASARGQLIGGGAFRIERTDHTTPALKNRQGDWVIYGGSITIEYRTVA